MGTKTQQIPMAPPPPMVQTASAEQSLLSETMTNYEGPPVAEARPLPRISDEELRARRVAEYNNSQARLQAEANSPDRATRVRAQSELQYREALQELTAAVRSDKITNAEFAARLDELNRRGNRATQTGVQQ